MREAAARSNLTPSSPIKLRPVSRVESQILFGVSLFRSSIFTAESLLLPLAELIATRRLPYLPFDLKLLTNIRRSLRQLLKEDAERIAQGYYPASVFLRSEPTSNPLEHFQRLPRIFQDAMSASRRRSKKHSKDFSPAAKRRTEGLPAYYQRNFHYQTDGYLGEESAALYDHQVEILFAGSADPMRRMLLAPLKRHFARSEGKGLRILELGCGSGSGTNFLRLAFPLARITAVDLSEPYLEVAARRVPSVNFLPAAAEALPFKDQEFDAVVSIFLFHELPLEVRKAVLAETHRVLKP
ncbi:MAG: class I SAM-dependent methyltransferase, partial [Proteobacteria bacterium]